MPNRPLPHAGSGTQRRTASPTSAAAVASVVTVPVRWEEPLPPIAMVNAVQATVDDIGDVVILIGQISPIALPADETQRGQLLSKLTEVVAKPLLRFSASPERIRNIIDQLEEILKIRERYRQLLPSKAAEPPESKLG
jgi:hypothetical protein